LLGHRTTEELPSEADIVIVGTGITGTSAARYLSEDARAKGKSIVVLDAREACWCATGRVSLTTHTDCELQPYRSER
jgi:glycine/D-amino acid oxidase-like deaminating enzyme